MKISRAVSRARAVGSLPLPPAFPPVHSLSPSLRCEFVLYADHLEALRESNNNYQSVPGIAKLDLLGGFIFSFPQGSLNGPKPISDSHCSTGPANQTRPLPGPLCLSLVVCLEATGARGSFPARPLTLILRSLIVKVVIPAATLASRKKGEK